MNLDTIFSPQRIALIGASRDETSVGFSLYKNLLSPSYKGKIFPVNPKTDNLLGKQVFRSISEIPETPDLAIIAIPAVHVIESVNQLAQKGVSAIIVISAGFKESGEEGKKREDELKELCKTRNITLIGPNCLGIVNPHIGLNASFETVLPATGSIAFISQSGALISSLLDIANNRGIGFSKVISVGNKAVVTEHELLPYLFADPLTKVILLYCEILNEAPNIISLVRKNTQSSTPKPIILLKAGITSAGQKASSSHTGSLAGSDAAYQALVAQAGIIRVKTINEMLSTAHIFATSPLPKNRNLAIITNAGGPGIIATDEADRAGLTLASFTQDTQKKLGEILPQASHISNPVDVLGDATSLRYEKTLEAVSADKDIESIITIVTPQSMTDVTGTANAVVKARDMSHKLIAASFMGEPLVDPGVDILTAHNIPHMQFPEDAVEAIGHAVNFYEITQKRFSEYPPSPPRSPHVTSIIENLQNANIKLVNMETTLSLLALSGLPVVKSTLVQSIEDALHAANEFSGHLAMKIVSPDISHKTDIGGVKLHVEKDQVSNAFREIMQNVSQPRPCLLHAKRRD